jgi:CRP/FNR family transcriptional regulator, anaerobic regulatory protein
MQDILRSLDETERALLEAASIRTVTLAPNRPLATEDEVGIELFRIEYGWAYRFRDCGKGCRQILDFILPGEIVGLEATLLGRMEHSVRSLTQLQATALDPRLTGQAFSNAPQLGLRFARYIAAEKSRVDQFLTVLGCGDAIERIAFLMVSLYRRQAQRDKIGPLNCPFPLRRQHLADALGLTGAHINRTLNRLREDGLVMIEDHRLVIRDLPRLAAIADSISGGPAGSPHVDC